MMQAPVVRSETVSRVSMPKPLVVPMEGFIIPVHRETPFAFISLRFSLCVWRKEVKEVLAETQKQPIRAGIYDVLAREFENRRDVPPLEEVKALILEGLRTAMPQGGIKDIFVTEFLPI
jgi:flagellar basal body-associated protein FliL